MHLAVGENLQSWRQKPGVTEVAYVDPRTRRQRELYERLRSGLIRELRVSGLSDLIPVLDDNLYAVTFNPRVSKAIEERIDQLAGLGFPTAVFVGPPGA